MNQPEKLDFYTMIAFYLILALFPGCCIVQALQGIPYAEQEPTAAICMVVFHPFLALTMIALSPSYCWQQVNKRRRSIRALAIVTLMVTLFGLGLFTRATREWLIPSSEPRPATTSGEETPAAQSLLWGWFSSSTGGMAVMLIAYLYFRPTPLET